MTSVIPIPLPLLRLEETVGFKYLLGMQATRSGITVPVSPGVLHWCISAVNSLHKSSADSASLIEATAFLEKVYAATKEHPFPGTEEDKEGDHHSTAHALEDKIDALIARVGGLETVWNGLEHRVSVVEALVTDAVIDNNVIFTDADAFSVSNGSSDTSDASSSTPKQRKGSNRTITTEEDHSLEGVTQTDSHSHDEDDGSVATSKDEQTDVGERGSRAVKALQSTMSAVEDWKSTVAHSASHGSKVPPSRSWSSSSSHSDTSQHSSVNNRIAEGLKRIDRLRNILDTDAVPSHDRQVITKHLDRVESRLHQLKIDGNVTEINSSTPLESDNHKTPTSPPPQPPTSQRSSVSSPTIVSWSPPVPHKTPRLLNSPGAGRTSIDNGDLKGHEPSPPETPRAVRQLHITPLSPPPFCPPSPPRQGRPYPPNIYGPNSHPGHNENNSGYRVQNNNVHHGPPPGGFRSFGPRPPRPVGVGGGYDAPQIGRAGYPTVSGASTDYGSDRESQWSLVSHSNTPITPRYPPAPPYDPTWRTVKLDVSTPTRNPVNVQNDPYGGW